MVTRLRRRECITTIEQARHALWPVMTIGGPNGAGEYRVNFKQNPTEATAYYTNCLTDAVETGLDMFERRLAELY